LGFDLPLPEVDLSFLENFLIWAREAIRRLEIQQMADVEFEHIIPLIEKRSDNKGSGIIDEGTFRTNVANTGNGVLIIDLTKSFDDAPLTRLWVRGVGLSFSDRLSVNDGGATALRRLMWLTAQIFPPLVRVFLGQIPTFWCPDRQLYWQMWLWLTRLAKCKCTVGQM
jgi:hypothetical protein